MTINFLICEMGTIVDFLRFKEDMHKKCLGQCLIYSKCMKGTLRVLEESGCHSLVAERDRYRVLDLWLPQLVPCQAMFVLHRQSQSHLLWSQKIHEKQIPHILFCSYFLYFPKPLIPKNYRFLLTYTGLSGPEFSWKILLRLQMY